MRGYFARISKELRAEGYLIKTASNGAEALAVIPDYCPDYVITDWNMPNVDGKMLCQCLRTASIEHYTYVILMTAHSDLLDLVEGLGAGADDYITKPVNIRELLARLTSGARILELDRRLHHVADHDALTGVLNRRNLFSSLSRVIEMCRRKRASVSCIMLDLDRFKKVNDEFGHVVGDQVLIRVAARLTSLFRNDDYICRYGGEEFAIVLPECDEQGAFHCAERCRLEIESQLFDSDNEHFQVTASFGVSQLNHGEGPTQMIDRADKALLWAKGKGRNAVVRNSEIPCCLPTLTGVEAVVIPQIAT